MKFSHDLQFLHISHTTIFNPKNRDKMQCHFKCVYVFWKLKLCYLRFKMIFVLKFEYANEWDEPRKMKRVSHVVSFCACRKTECHICQRNLFKMHHIITWTAFSKLVFIVEYSSMPPISMCGRLNTWICPWLNLLR